MKDVYIVTGYSGAGKTTVLHSFEDLGYYCIDNLPIELIQGLFNSLLESKIPAKKIVLGLDIRASQNISDLINELHNSKIQISLSIKIIFLSASNDILVNRYQQTRRKHPLMNSCGLLDAINYEKKLLEKLRQITDIIIDTDKFTNHQLRKFVYITFCNNQLKTVVNLLSFGFKYGIPQESNFMWDLRSLPNPYFISELRAKNGTSEDIQQYLFAHDDVRSYLNKLNDFLIFIFETLYNEGRPFVTMAFGCTGGKHRSVAFVERLAKTKLDYIEFLVNHRDLYKDGSEIQEV